MFSFYVYLILEPQERNSPRMISLMQDVLNLLNFCSSENDTPEKILGIIFYMLNELPGCALLTLPIITAGKGV